ncbi:MULTISPECIES: tetratricopeptide repeat protein [Pseudofrankia]|uniref:tetratricopeptide repeat protein n=1 Tax=Pseudofrankia TaxID=2994363 RepID=UPI000234D00B|nr:molecular chaperone Tir [Pseudofrankia sp. EUN1h]
MIDGGSKKVAGDGREGWDFFVSYTAADQAWAEWISWQLEAGGYRVLVQAWDFVAGTNWQIRMQQGILRAQRTVAVLSAAYLSSVYGQNEWLAAQAADPHGFARKLLPVRIEDCPRPGLMSAIVSIDLFDLDPAQANRHLLDRVRHAVSGRAKPATAPDFPVHRLNAPTSEPVFPAGTPERAGTSADYNQSRGLNDELVRQRGELGADHLETLATADKLSLELIRLGDRQEAQALAEDTLRRRRSVLGADHLDSLTTASILVLALSGLGDHETARTVAEDTFQRLRRLLGADRAETLTAANDLVDALIGLGDHKAARTLAEDTLQRQRRVRGADHAETLATAHHLVGVLNRLADFKAARTLAEDTLRRERRKLGNDDAETLNSADDLAFALSGLGDYQAARTLAEDTLRRRRTVGADRAETLTTAHNLAIDLIRLGDHKAARTLAEDTLRRRRRTLGADHADTHATERVLAIAREEARRATG